MAREDFYRDTPVRDVGLALRRFWTTNFLFRCPACGRGDVRAGFFGVESRCEVCGSRFERLPGNFLISMTLNFFFVCVAVVLVAASLIWRFGFFTGLTETVIFAACMTAVLLLRPMRVLTLWFLWMLGFVYPDR